MHRNTLTRGMFNATSEDPIVLVNGNIGFRLSYLRQFVIRQFRSHTSCLSEASTILQTYPWSVALCENRLERLLLQAVWNYMVFLEGRFGRFDITDPIAPGDRVFDQPCVGLHTIFTGASAKLCAHLPRISLSTLACRLGP